MGSGEGQWRITSLSPRGRFTENQHRRARARWLSEILDGQPATAGGDDAAAPRAIFTDPQVAAVGLTLRAARGQRADARAYDVPSSGTARGAFYGTGTPGTARLVVDETRGVIVWRDLHRHRRCRLAAGGDDRNRQQDTGRAAVAGRSALPYPQRDLAETARAPRGRSRCRALSPAPVGNAGAGRR